MPGVRSMLTRIRRLEQTSVPALSPIAAQFGSFAAFAAWAGEQTAAGVLDARDFPLIVQCLASWERNGIWTRDEAKLWLETESLGRRENGSSSSHLHQAIKLPESEW